MAHKIIMIIMLHGKYYHYNNPEIINPHRLGKGRKGRSRLEKIPKESSPRAAWYKGPWYGLATPRYILRSCSTVTVGPWYNKPKDKNQSRLTTYWDTKCENQYELCFSHFDFKISMAVVV